MPRGKDLKVRKRRFDRQTGIDLVPCQDCRLVFMRSLLSKARLCRHCSARRVEDCCRQMRDKRGEIYERWQRNRELAKIGMKGGING